MLKIKNDFLLGLVFITCVSCSAGPNRNLMGNLPVDPLATRETKALYLNLKKLAGKHILFGQQDALAYGVGRSSPDSEFCDVKDVCGSYPAVYGWDIGGISGSANLDSVAFRKITRLIRQGYSRGGIITVSWHEGNPGGTDRVYDTTPVVKRLLPGGDLHGEFTRRLTLVGRFFHDLMDAQGRPIPVIFRPYHEHNGDWFWWGRKSCSEEEYIALFRFTVEFLRDSLQVHQLLYAISPDKSRMDPNHLERDLLYAYPGDEYIDILGFDNYWDVGNVSNYDPSVSRQRQDTLFVSSLRALIKIAERKNKIPALTETGCNALVEINWYTDRILKPLKAHPDIRKIAYLLVWRNASLKHFYTPYPGHASCQDFITFRKDGLMLFEDDLPGMYVFER